MDRILVVDDDPATRRLLRATLVSSGYEVIEAGNGEEGLRKAYEQKPNLIISDVLMPVMDGHQLAKHLRNDAATASVPIVMLTGVREEQDELRAFQEGVDEYIVKPVRPAVLHARVDALLARARALRGEPAIEPCIASEPEATPGRLVSGSSWLDEVLGSELPQAANVLLVGETGSGKSSLCRRFLAAGLGNLERCMMITLDDDPAMIRQSLDTLLPKPLIEYQQEGNFRLVDGYSWTKGSTRGSERFAVGGILELNQLAGIIADAGQEIGQSIGGKSGGRRVFDSISSLVIHFELALVQRFVAQLARTATSYGNVSTLFVVEEGAVSEQALNNIKYVMDGLLETKVSGDRYFARVANMKWRKFSREWIQLEP